MIKRLLFNLTLFLLAVSCTKLSEENSVILKYGKLKVNTDITIDTKAYTAIAATNELNITDLNYFFFSSSGKLLKYINIIRSQSATANPEDIVVELPVGNIKVCVVANVNQGQFQNVKTYDQLRSIKIHHFTSPLKNRIPFYGETTVILEEDNEATGWVELERRMSRLNVCSIRNYLSGQLKGKTIQVTSIFLANIQGGFTIGEQNTEFWYNKFGRNDTNPAHIGDFDTMVPDGTSIWPFSLTTGNISIPHGMLWSTRNGSCLLYCFPNYTEVDENGWDSVFTPRYTRLVLETVIDNVTYYYPVNLVGLRHNRSYDVRFIITRPGSSDPDTFDLVEFEDVFVDFGGIDGDFDIDIEM